MRRKLHKHHMTQVPRLGNKGLCVFCFIPHTHRIGGRLSPHCETCISIHPMLAARDRNLNFRDVY